MPEPSSPFFENSSKPDKDEQPKIKRPEFIIIDDTKDYVYGSTEASPFEVEEDEIWQMQRKKNPFWLRMLCLVGLLFCIFFASSVFLYATIMGILATVFLFQNKDANQSFFRFWRIFTNTLVSALSLTIGFFSPTLGLGMLILYFSMKGQKEDRAFLKNMFKKFL